MTKERKQLIKELKSEISDIEDMNRKHWGMQEGVLLTGGEAQLFVDLLEQSTQTVEVGGTIQDTDFQCVVCGTGFNTAPCPKCHPEVAPTVNVTVVPNEGYIVNLPSVDDDKPIVIERFADNGNHSHWELISLQTGETLWTEDDEDVPPVECCDEPKGFYLGTNCLHCNKPFRAVKSHSPVEENTDLANEIKE